MEIRPMREGDREAVLDLLETAFGQRAVFERYMDHDPLFLPQDFLLAMDGERPVSTVQVFEKRIRLRGRTVPLGGIGSVATHPAYRRRGLAAELMTRQTELMRSRGMAIGLLFSGLVHFYGSLGWVQVPVPILALHPPPHPPPKPSAPRPGLKMRSFEPRDLSEIRRLYDEYCDQMNGTTVRDAGYWDGQLRYAGNPDECFRVAERAGTIAAYARSVALSEVTYAMEYAYRTGETDALVPLLLGLCPPDAALFCRIPPDPALRRSLERAAARVSVFEDPTPMWRVLDASALGRIAGLRGAVEDRELLLTLLREPQATYWHSDRF